MKNLTPHVINIYSADGKELLVSIPPSGEVARCSVKSEQVGVEFVMDFNIPLFRTTFGKVEGLPAEDFGTFAVGTPPTETYIVSLLVRQALPHRKDLFSPGELIRDDKGQPIGCCGLTCN